MSPSQICTSVTSTSTVIEVALNMEHIFFKIQENDILPIVEELQCPTVATNNISFYDNLMTETEQVRFSGYFTSDTIFSLSRKLLSKAEVKELDIAGIKFHFKNGSAKSFSDKPSFSSKSSGN